MFKKCQPKKFFGENCGIMKDECMTANTGLDCINKVCQCKEKNWIPTGSICRKCPLSLSYSYCKILFLLFTKP